MAHSTSTRSTSAGGTIYTSTRPVTPDALLVLVVVLVLLFTVVLVLLAPIWLNSHMDQYSQ